MFPKIKERYCMPEKKYIDYRFLGVQSFRETLGKNNVEHRVFDDDIAPLYEKYAEILNAGEDTVRTGIIIRDGQMIYFAEFGVKLTKSFHAYYVFIFDHHPTLDDLGSVAGELESLAECALDGIDISSITGPPHENELH